MDLNHLLRTIRYGFFSSSWSNSAYTTSLLSLIFPATGFPCFFNEPVMLLGFILIGRFLEERARYQTGSSIGDY